MRERSHVGLSDINHTIVMSNSVLFGDEVLLGIQRLYILLRIWKEQRKLFGREKSKTQVRCVSNAVYYEIKIAVICLP